MKKEKHTGFWVTLALLILLLILGIVLLAIGVTQGPNPLFVSPPVAI